MSDFEIPLFPLNTVLFRGGVLPLRIFEPRYVDMVKRCMRTGTEFGVVAICKGEEVGPDAKFHQVGTLTQIVDFDQLPDGLLGITTRGTERFRCVSCRVQTDGLNVGTIERMPSPAPTPLPGEFANYAQLLAEALPQMGDYFKYLLPNYEDADWVSGRLAEILPISLAAKQQLLEIDDPIDRLQTMRPMMRGEAAN